MLGSLEGLLAFQPLHAGQSEWLAFPMHPQDTAQAVHLAALKMRPDGLLESASRYPRDPKEPWSDTDRAVGRYNYERRLIDCRSGEFFSYEFQLWDEEGQVLAKRSATPEELAEWKQRLMAEPSPSSWPNSSEIFLACAAAGDPSFLRQRQKDAQKKVPSLSYRPILQDMLRDRELMAQRSVFDPDLDRVVRSQPRTATDVFERLRRQDLGWLRSFMAQPPIAAVGTRTPAPSAPSLTAEWLKETPYAITLLASSGDGAVRFIDHRPLQRDLPPGMVTPPSKAEEATAADAEMRVDCLTGRTLAMQLTWLDGQGKPLAVVPVPPKELVKEIRYWGGDEIVRVDIRVSPLRDRALAVCRAAAAECRGTLPEPESDTPPTNTLPASAVDGDTPQAALLALRRFYIEESLKDVPTCRFGKY